MCVRNLGRLEAAAGVACGVQPCRQMQRTQRRAEYNKERAPGGHLGPGSGGHASNSNPRPPLAAARRAFRPRRTAAAAGIGNPRCTPPHHNWQHEAHAHGWDWDASNFHQKIYRLIPGVSSDAMLC